MEKSESEKAVDANYYIKKWAKEKNAEWLNFLCSRIIDTKKPIEEYELGKLYELFLFEYGLGEKTQDEELQNKNEIKKVLSDEKENKISSVKILSLTHVEGANALKEDETIKFHPKLTVFFGHNGAGKSGYTRILKRASGTSDEDIWSNVHIKKEKNICKAKFSLAVNEKVEHFNWQDGEQIAPFNVVKIFDGKSIPIYLNEKIKFSLAPYGLDLFSFITNAFVLVKQRLEDDIRQKTFENKFLNYLRPGTEAYNFVSKVGPETDLNEISKLIGDVAEIKKKLKQNRDEYKRILSLEEKLKVLRNEEKLIIRLASFVEGVDSGFSKEQIDKYREESDKWKEKEKEVQKKSLANFSKYGISGAGSFLWHNFISSAEKYIESLKKTKYPAPNEKCIYCNQDLSQEAADLIQLYRDYMDGTAEKILQQIKISQNEYCKKAENIAGNHFAEDESELEGILGKELKEKVFIFLDKVNQFVKNLTIGLLSKNLNGLEDCVDNELKKEMRAIKAKLQKEIAKAEADYQKFSEKSRRLSNEIINLDELLKLNEHKKEIQDYIAGLKWVEKAESLVSKLNTKPITDLQKKAWKKLVSDNFEGRFQRECENLMAPKVELSFPAEYGVQKRAKSFEGLKNIDEFLSEGEQHSVALADLFAEIHTDSINAPIILDDPVSSMDEIRRDKLAQRIVEESQKRQIVVFTHDLLFLSYIYDRVAKKKNGTLDSEKSAFHWIEGTRDVCGIFNEDSCPRIARLERTQKEVEKLIVEAGELKGSEKESKIKECYSEMREMLECIVVEKLFKKVVERWNERIQMLNLDKVDLDEEKYKKAKRLFEEFSRYITGHSHSATSMQDFPNIDKLKSDFQSVGELYI